MSKFDNVPMEKDTELYFSGESIFGDYDVLYQKWRWDGIAAESLIFVAEDVESMDDDALKAYVAESPLVDNKDDKMTLTRNSKGFTLVNFNFGAR